MPPNDPQVSDFSTGRHLPGWLIRLIHHKWRFYIAAASVLIIGSLAVVGIKMPWKSTHISDSPQESGQAIPSG